MKHGAGVGRRAVAHNLCSGPAEGRRGPVVGIDRHAAGHGDEFGTLVYEVGDGVDG